MFFVTLTNFAQIITIDRSIEWYDRSKKGLINDVNFVKDDIFNSVF